MRTTAKHATSILGAVMEKRKRVRRIFLSPSLSLPPSLPPFLLNSFFSSLYSQDPLFAPSLLLLLLTLPPPVFFFLLNPSLYLSLSPSFTPSLLLLLLLHSPPHNPPRPFPPLALARSRLFYSPLFFCSFSPARAGREGRKKERVRRIGREDVLKVGWSVGERIEMERGIEIERER